VTVGLQLGGQAFREVILSSKDKTALDDFTRGNFDVPAAGSLSGSP
jgi:hypothetical protein